MKTLVVAAALMATSTIAAEAAGPMLPDNVYVQLLGGFSAGNLAFSDGTNPHTMSPGLAFGAAVGFQVMDGASVEVDMLHAARSYTDYEPDSQVNTSLMLNVKGTLPLNETFSLYGAVGLGIIHSVNYQDGGGAYGYGGTGYQLIGGTTAVITQNISAVIEGRVQSSFGTLRGDFDPMENVDGGPVFTVVGGVKVGM
jgi:opacity protein-like surface antigen